LFSESHSRYLLVLEKKKFKQIEIILKKNRVSYKMIGKFVGNKIQFNKQKKSIINLSVDKTQKIWVNSLRELVMNG
jgi:phosphoribosylformylglycinamidine synthase